MNWLKFQKWQYIFIFVFIFFTAISIAAYNNSPVLFWGWEGELYWRFYTYVSRGEMPFINFFIEYPPFAAYFIAIPALFSRSFSQLQFLSFFASISAILALSVPFIFNWTFSKIQNGSTAINKTSATLLSIYLLLLIPNFTLLTTRYDVFPAFFSFLGICLYLISLKRSKWIWSFSAYLILAIATFIKIYPILIIVLLVLLDIWRRKWLNIGTALVALFLISLPTTYFVINGQQNFQSFIQYQTASRDLQIESIWASVAFGLEKVKLLEPSVIQLQSGSMELTNAYAKSLARQNLLIIAFILAISFLALIFKLKPWKDKTSWSLSEIKQIKFRIPTQDEIIRLTVIGSLFLITTFMLWNKVFSPQYLLWVILLLPLLGLLEYSRKELMNIGIGWFLISLLTLIIYPLSYGALTATQTPMVIVLIWRNLLILAWWWWLIKELITKPTTN
jgi:hypothetical protein